MWGVLIWGATGLLAGALAALGLALLAIPVFGISQMEGAYAMSVAFFWVPLGAVLGLAGGAIFGLVRRR